MTDQKKRAKKSMTGVVTEYTLMIKKSCTWKSGQATTDQSSQLCTNEFQVFD